MASTTLFRLATRTPATSFFKAAPYAARARVSAAVPAPVFRASAFSTTPMRFSGAHEEETFEQFSARFVSASRFPRLEPIEKKSHCTSNEPEMLIENIIW
ncbi:uncharacterized protein ARB_06711 [Trichophyton benhamiae CBS 112371]|uniref:Uncharacterized protein n=1 Tax=Arthroderma benhamiae (strain ATCC MYA-4681 / CBS 112371) TaxID=663331 RepID=D4ARG9_ARTBC|nr:uncharacterized protein ARB_06711 [Trichophyton benhamiae CBS 112371]EFE34312.1 hypothetical protein ARB_06711 [Trichophyton benhamiae CBS 112371]